MGVGEEWGSAWLHPRLSTQPVHTHIPHGFGSSCICREAKRPRVAPVRLAPEQQEGSGAHV